MRPSPPLATVHTVNFVKKKPLQATFFNVIGGRHCLLGAVVVTTPAPQHLMTLPLVLSRLDYGNATLVGIPMYQLKRPQSVLNAAARLVFSAPRRDHVSPLLLQLHWLKAPERIQYKLAVLVYKCLNGMAPSYLADEFLQPADLTTRTRLRSARSLFIRRTRWSTVGDRAFPVAAARV